jgi:hypothetical protein
MPALASKNAPLGRRCQGFLFCSLLVNPVPSLALTCDEIRFIRLSGRHDLSWADLTLIQVVNAARSPDEL